MLATVVALYLLAVLDGCFGAICTASGRNAMIHKRWYYAKAMGHGALFAQIACLAGLLIIAVCIWASHDRATSLMELQKIGWRMAEVLGTYALIVLVIFLIRAIPSVDIRSATSTIAFGPLTLVHPLVVIVATVWGLYHLPSTPVLVATLSVATIMLLFRDGMGIVLGRYYLNLAE